MFLTARGIGLLLLAAPLLAGAGFAPILRWVALSYIVAVGALLLFDWRLAETTSRFELERQHDARLSLGADNAVELILNNRGQRPLKFWVRDEPPERFKTEVGILKGEVAGHHEWREMYHVQPIRRGDYEFGDLNIRWQGPLALILRQRRFETADTVKVYPNLLNVRRYDLLLRRNRLQEIGLRHTRMFGEGTEFERLREYLPDDQYSRIDWKATARRHRPVTIEYQTERSQNVVAVVDTGRMMQSPVNEIAKLDYVINAVLLLAYVATGKGDKIGLMTFADDVGQFVAPRQGRGQFYRMLEMLYAVEPQPVEPDYRKALGYLALKQRKRSLVVIFTDLSGGLSMQMLVSHVSVLARRSLPLVVTISDPDIQTASTQTPEDSLSVYQRAAATRMLDERRVVLDTLKRQGVLTLDVAANQLSIAVINRYLELKAKTLL